MILTASCRAAHLFKERFKNGIIAFSFQSHTVPLLTEPGSEHLSIPIPGYPLWTVQERILNTGLSEEILTNQFKAFKVALALSIQSRSQLIFLPTFSVPQPGKSDTDFAGFT